MSKHSHRTLRDGYHSSFSKNLLFRNFASTTCCVPNTRPRSIQHPILPLPISLCSPHLNLLPPQDYLLNSDTLGQVPGEIHIQPFADRKPIAHELQRNHVQQALQHVDRVRHFDALVLLLGEFLVGRVADYEGSAAARGYCGWTGMLVDGKGERRKMRRSSKSKTKKASDLVGMRSWFWRRDRRVFGS